jgi:hypothetical protein
MPKKLSPYRFVTSNLMNYGERLFPFQCFGEPRNWTEIAKELDIITERYRSEFPKFDMREHGWVYIYTRKEGKRRVFIE